MDNNTFTCCICKETFTKGRSDQEADLEKKALFPMLTINQAVMCCEPCFIKVMDFNEPGQKRYAPFITKENSDA